ncbi:MAG: hypothetical protein ABR906_03200 [Terracidiphilus sp.]|jgi:hypothetical protein
MRINFRTIALVTAVTIVLEQIFGIYITLTGNPTFPWTLIVQFAVGVLVSVLFSALLFMLYKTGTIPELSGKLRKLAIAIVLVSGLIFVAGSIDDLFRIDHRELLRYALSQLPGIVYILYLAALSLQDHGRPAANERQARLVWNTARITLLAVWVSVAMGVVRIAVSTVRREKMLAAYHLTGGAVRWAYHLRHAGEILSLLCTAIAAWILYKGLSIANEARLKAYDSTAD